jgi:Phosphoglycerol transferase and related proteins, alkaline phosphatase superfamily
MKYIKQILIRLLALNIIFLILMSIFRFIFFLYYGKGIDFAGFSGDIVKAFYMGVRYDAAVISYLNMPAVLCFVILLLVSKAEYFKKYLVMLKYYYTFFIGTLLVLLCVDFGYYSYFQNHLNILVFGFFEDDTKALISTFYENYNLFLIFAGFILIFALIFFLSKYILKINHTAHKTPKGFIFKIVLSLVLIFLNFITARGSFGIFPLGVDNAEVSSNVFLNKVSINCVYTLQAAIEARNNENKGFDYIDKAGYKNNIRKAFADFLDKNIEEIPENIPEQSLVVKLPFNKNIDEVKPNIIFIVMESLGADLIKYNSDTFNVLGELKRHFDEDYVFYNFLPGHEGTIGSLEAAITNVGRRPYSKYLSQSKYAYEKYKFSGPVPYKQNGYETIFMYGGNSGWRNVGSFMPNLGFDKVIGEGSMNKEYPRNQWGVYDEYLFDYIFQTMESGDKKKFIYVMTTSNHPPYSIPGEYKPFPLNVPPELEKYVTGADLAEKRFAVYQYSNEMLGKFITRIKESDFSDNTIIAVTGDHNFWNVVSYSGERLFDSLSVPFYLYIPEKLKPVEINTEVFGSHMDIMPTLYHLSLSDTEYMAMGKNLLSKEASDNIAFSDVGAVIDKEYVIKYNFKEKNASFYRWDENGRKEIKKSAETAGHKRLIKHYVSLIAVSDYLIKDTGTK